MRITRKDIDTRINRVNSALGIDEVHWNTSGAIVPYSAYNAIGINRVCDSGSGQEQLLGLGTNKEAWAFLGGMLAAISIEKDY